MVNKTGVVNVNSNILKVLKSRFFNLDDHDFSKQALHILAEKCPVSAYNLMMLNKLPGNLVAINARDTIPGNIEFTQCQVKPAQNCEKSKTGDLTRLLTLKLESEVMLTVDINIQDRLING